MKKLLFLFAMCMATGTTAVAQSAAETPFAVPQLKSWKTARGTFNTDTREIVVTTKKDELKAAADYMKRSMHLMRPVKDKKTAATIELKLQNMGKKGDEAYKIDIKPRSISISGASPRAVLWGVQTILQMSEQNKQLPCGTIQDNPDYKLRGFVIDVARKFVPLDYLYSLVRTMSYSKMNCLQVHLHDHGFKKYFHEH